MVESKLCPGDSSIKFNSSNFDINEILKNTLKSDSWIFDDTFWDLKTLTDFTKQRKTPIFKTFDGVDIYDNETPIYGCSNGSHGDFNKIGDNLYTLKYQKDVNTTDFNWFSSEYDRQRWIIENSEYIQYVGSLE
ncbi:MAG: hypothetical protein PF487_07230, partial [Bacteroidales bacterium]|nr:hypothetical protein [Bacteroidales bacterium]